MHCLTSFNESGQIVHRSKNFSSREEAESCANWINGLRRFKSQRNRYAASVVKNARTKREAYYVELLPLSPDRQAENLSREQGKRQEKALAEGASYQFTLLGDDCATVKSRSGETYVLYANRNGVSCNCEDSKKTFQQVACKHALAARNIIPGMQK